MTEISCAWDGGSGTGLLVASWLSLPAPPPCPTSAVQIQKLSRVLCATCGAQERELLEKQRPKRKAFLVFSFFSKAASELPQPG